MLFSVPRTGDDSASAFVHPLWMLLSTEKAESTAGTVVVWVVLIAGVIFALGYGKAVMDRANQDYKTTKAAVPVLRKAFWGALWNVTKVGFWVVLIAFALVMYAIHGDDDADATTPTPASISPSPSHRR